MEQLKNFNDYGISDEFRNSLLNTLKAFITFCEENDLHYYAECGTCLGAIRHKGFIPWDDDIDVDMPREDYERMIALRDKLKGTGYEILNTGDDNYTNAYAKFCDANSTIWERKCYPCIYGTFVDVFPLDEVEDEVLSQKLSDQLKRATAIYYFSMCDWKFHYLWKKIKGFHFKGILSFFYNRYVRSNRREHYLRKMRAICTEIKKQHGDRYLQYGGFYGFQKMLFSKSVYGAGVKVPFEDTEIVVPEHYEAYLTQIYSDWRTPPPPEKRTSHHYHYFIDLTRRWTIDEVMRLNLPEEKKIIYTYE